MAEQLSHAEQNACGWLDAIKEHVACMDADRERLADGIRQRIEESPLSVQVRDGWKSPGAESDGPEEFEILLSTGGPALRIIGELDEHCQPTRARLQHQDWGTPWTDFGTTSADDETVLRWASCFYFGE